MKVYELTYQKNIRDLGGLKGYHHKKIKMGRLFRGGSLHRVSDEDVLIIDSFHLTDIVDFRSIDGFHNKKDYIFSGVTYHNFPCIIDTIKPEDRNKEDGNLLWFIDKGNSGHNHLKSTYKDLIESEVGRSAYKNFFKLLLSDKNRRVYFHCSQGKDRAGIAAFLLEMGLGVSLKDAKKDYLYSNIAMEKRIEGILLEEKNKPYFSEEYRKSLIDVFHAKLEYLEETIEVLNNKYGGVIPYLENILEVDIKKLRDYYLE